MKRLLQTTALALATGLASPQEASPQTCYGQAQVQSPRPIIISRNYCGWGKSLGWNGWSGGWWGPPFVSISYGTPRPQASSGFGIWSVPETKIHKVPAPINLTNSITVHKETNFQWKR
jgi:hypothetical protein